MFFYSSPSSSPYAYGLSGAVPSPMAPAPAPTLPPLHPSMITPQLSPPAPFPNNNLLQAHYARGGHVEGLREAAEDLRGYGRHGDTMLAHISPAEALMLRAMGGSGTINPHTGLPEYFSFGDVFKKYVGPVVGSVLGTFLGGPVGGAIGGAIGGSFGHPKNRIGPLKGGAMGFFAGPTLLGGGAGLMGGGGMSGMLSGAGQGFGSSMGMLHGGLSNLMGGGAGAVGGGGSLGMMGGLSRLAGAAVPAAPGAAGSAGAAGAAGAASAGGGGLLSALGGGGGLLNTALLGTAILGTLGRRESTPDQGGPASMAAALAQAQPHWRPEQYPRRRRPYRNQYRPLPKDYDPARHGEHRFFEPEEEEGEEHRYYGGYIDDATGGQDDRVKASLSGGEFVLPADVVSDLGDGNNKAGAEKMYGLMRNVRHHKGRNGLPPKARPIASYLR